MEPLTDLGMSAVSVGGGNEKRETIGGMTPSPQQQRRDRLQWLHDSGITDTKTLCQMTGLGRASVFRLKRKMVDEKTVSRKPGSGRRPILQSDDRRRLAQLAHKHDRLSNRRLGKLMQDKGSPPVSRFTIGRTLVKQGFRRLKPRPRPELTARHKAARLAWCLENRNRDWSNVIITDESKFQFYSNVRKLLCKKRKDAGKPKFGPSRMVWGGIAMRGNTTLALIKGTVDSLKYQEILDHHLTPTMSVLYPDGYVLQQDNAPCHVSRSSKAWLESEGIEVMKWPANSPDLSVIENVWGWMKNELGMMSECNTDEWERRIIDLWDNLSHEYLKSLFDSIPGRIEQCIEREGGYTDN